MNSFIFVSYVSLSILILIIYYFLSIKRVRFLNRKLLLLTAGKIGLVKNNITPVLVFSLAFFAYSALGISARIGSNETSGHELFLFSLTCFVGLFMFLLGYGLDVSTFKTGVKDNKRVSSFFKNGIIAYAEIAIIVLFVLMCIIFRKRLIDMIINFGSGESYSDYAIRGERTATTGLTSAFSSYFTLIILCLPFYRSFRDKKIHFLDLIIFIIVFSFDFFSGNRTNLVLAALLFAVLLNHNYFHFKMRYILLLTIFGLFVLVLVGHLRKYNNFESMSKMFSSERLAEMFALQKSGEFFNTTGTTFSYIHSIQQGNKSFDFGYIYIIDFLMFIPSFLFPSRMLPPQEQYMLDFFPSALSGTGHGWFITTDGYRALGVLGVGLEMFIFGKVLKYVYKKFFDSSTNPLTNFIYVYLLLFIFYSIRSSFVLSIKNYIIAILPLLFVAAISKLAQNKNYVQSK